MEIQAELANAIKQRYAKVHGVPKTIRKTAKQHGKSTGRKEPQLSETEQVSRRESKKAAAAALMTKMGGSSRQSSSSSATSKGGKKKKSWKVSLSSPKVSSTVTGGDPLSKTEEETAQRYRKMVKMGLTEGAIRHKMISDCVSERIVEAVMSGKNSSNSQAPISDKLPVDSSKRRSSLSLEEEKIAEKYRKMAKIGMPEGAIRHKMISDCVSERIVEAVNSGEDSFHSQTPVSRKVSMDTSDQQFSLTLEEERIYEKYRKMAKIGMPEGAIRHKMIADGVSVKIQDAVLAGDSSSAAPTRTASNLSTTRYKKENDTAANRGDSTRSNRSSLSTEEEKIAAQYRRMIKIKMPDGAVRHKMTADGVSPKIQDSVLGREVPETLSPLSPPSSSSRGGESKGNISSLSREDETTAAPYRKMMKMRMPEGAVKHKMAVDRISTSIQNSVLREEIPAHDSLRRGDGTAATPMHSPANPLTAAIKSSARAGSSKVMSMNERKTAGVVMSSNPLLGAIASSGGIGSLKKKSTNEKKPAAGAISPNPLVAAIASSGGIKSLKKKSMNEKKRTTAAMPSNPLAAAIAASGGKTGLKKTSPNDKKMKQPKLGSGNTLLDELSSRGFSSSLRRTVPKTPEQSPKFSTGNALADEITSKGFRSALRKNPQKSPDQSPDVSNSDSLTDKPSYNGSNLQEKTSKSSMNKDYPRRDRGGVKVKSVRSPKQSPEENTNVTNSNNSRRHLGGIKVKSVRSQKESVEESTIFFDTDNSPRRHLGGIKVKSIRSREKFPEGSTDITNADDSLRHLGGVKVKSEISLEKSSERNNDLKDDKISRQFQSGIEMKSVRSPEEQPERGTDCTHENITRRFQSGIKVKSVRLLEEKPKSTTSTGSDSKNSSGSLHSVTKIQEEQTTIHRTNGHVTSRLESGIQVKSIRLPLEQPTSYASTGTGSKNSSRGFQFAGKSEDKHRKSITDAHCQDLAASETDLEREMNKNFRNQTSGARRKVRNSQLKHMHERKRLNFITTEDGVDHHCVCILM